MSELTLVYSYYESPQMLAEHYRVWSEYSTDLKDKIAIVIVDDCSKKQAQDVSRPSGLPNLEIYRILIKLDWNWDTARNIGVSKASSYWVLMTDIDHLVTEDCLRTILSYPKDLDCAYVLQRQFENREYIASHVNSWVMTASLYSEIGGYDEDFAGVYGAKDLEFRDRVIQTARFVHEIPAKLTWYNSIGDASAPLSRARDEVLEWRITDWKNRTGRGIARDKFPYARVL